MDLWKGAVGFGAASALGLLGLLTWKIDHLHRLVEQATAELPAKPLQLQRPHSARPSSPTSQELAALETLMYMHDAVSNDREVDNVIERIIRVGYNVLRVERISVMLLSKDKKKLVVVESQDAEGASIDASKGIAGFVVQTGETVNIPDAYSDPRFNATLDQEQNFRTKSVLCCAIVSNEEIVGVIEAINKLGQQDEVIVFSKEDESMIRYIAANAGIALKKAQLYSHAVRAKRQSQALLSIVQASSSNAPLERLIHTIIDAAYQYFLAERVSLFLVDHVRDELWIGVSRDGLEGLTCPIGQGIAGYVARHGVTLNIPDAYKDARFNPDVDKQTGFRTRSVLCMPVPGIGESEDLTTTSRPIAVLQVINKVNNQVFDAEDEEALQLFCQEVSAALRRRVVEASFLKVITSTKLRPDEIARGVLETSLIEEYGSATDGCEFQAELVVRKLTSARVRRPSALSPSWPSEVRLRRQESLASAISNWDLAVFSEGPENLAQYLFQMYRVFNLLGRFSIEDATLQGLIMSAQNLYHPNSFHNFEHAFSVTHTTFLILSEGAAQIMGSLEVLAALTSALCHDLDHPGHNNGFEVSCESQLALLYCEDAVLERHHAHMAFQILREPGSDITANLKPDEKKSFRKMVFEAILGTDMARHFRHVEFLDKHSAPNAPLSREDPNHRVHFMSAIVHCADLSGQAMKPELAHEWGRRCIQEFRHQAEKEANLGLPVTPFMANLDNELKQHELQHNFVTTIVLPLWTALAAVVSAVRHRVDVIEVNRSFYKARIDTLQPGKLSPPLTPPALKPRRSPAPIQVVTGRSADFSVDDIEQVIEPLTPAFDVTEDLSGSTIDEEEEEQQEEGEQGESAP